MTKPANDDFSQHLSDDEALYHEDASDNGTATNKPKQQQQQQQLIPTTTTILNIKLPILKKEEYDIWAMEMEHYLEYIDNDVWKGLCHPMGTNDGRRETLFFKFKELERRAELNCLFAMDDRCCNWGELKKKERSFQLKNIGGQSFDMKTPAPAKDYTCLIAKATSDDLKWGTLGSDNGTEFKNRDMLEFYGNKGIKQEYSNARTPQQNGVAERMNKDPN
ncbi:ribonuclease H-like domain-containing protein [Tanacetum coccineum]